MEEYIKLLDLPDEFDSDILKTAYRNKAEAYQQDETKMKLIDEANNYLKGYLAGHDGKYTKPVKEETQNNDENRFDNSENEYYEDEYEETNNKETGNLSFVEQIIYMTKLMFNPKQLNEELNKTNARPFATFKTPKDMLIFVVLAALVLYPIFRLIDKHIYPENNEQKQEVVRKTQNNTTKPAGQDLQHNNKDSQPDNTVRLDNSTELGKYMGEVQKNIKRNWNLPESALKENGLDEVKVTVAFTVSKNGSLAGRPRIIQSSGLDIADQRCLQAVELSAPFKPFPEEIKKDGLDMQFTFEANRNQ